MIALKPTTVPQPRFPWEEGRACREDRAMGLELELIELVQRRRSAAAHGDPVERLDDQIDEVMSDLAAEAAILGAA